MTLKTLGLRRTAPRPAAPAPILIRDDFDIADYDSVGMNSTYGLDRTPTGPKRFRNKPATPTGELVEVKPAPELVQPAAGAGEAIPALGPYTDASGCRWLNGVPAFLFDARPQSNIR